MVKPCVTEWAFAATLLVSRKIAALAFAGTVSVMSKRPFAEGVNVLATVVLPHSSCCSTTTGVIGLVSGSVTWPVRVTVVPEAFGGSSRGA